MCHVLDLGLLAQELKQSFGGDNLPKKASSQYVAPGFAFVKDGSGSFLLPFLAIVSFLMIHNCLVHYLQNCEHSMLNMKDHNLPSILESFYSL